MPRCLDGQRRNIRMLKEFQEQKQITDGSNKMIRGDVNQTIIHFFKFWPLSQHRSTKPLNAKNSEESTHTSTSGQIHSRKDPRTQRNMHRRKQRSKQATLETNYKNRPKRVCKTGVSQFRPMKEKRLKAYQTNSNRVCKTWWEAQFSIDSSPEKVDLDLRFIAEQLHHKSEIHRRFTRQLFAK